MPGKARKSRGRDRDRGQVEPCWAHKCMLKSIYADQTMQLRSSWHPLLCQVQIVHKHGQHTYPRGPGHVLVNVIWTPPALLPCCSCSSFEYVKWQVEAGHQCVWTIYVFQQAHVAGQFQWNAICRTSTFLAINFGSLGDERKSKIYDKWPRADTHTHSLGQKLQDECAAFSRNLTAADMWRRNLGHSVQFTSKVRAQCGVKKGIFLRESFPENDIKFWWQQLKKRKGKGSP